MRIEQRGLAQTGAKHIRRLQPFADGLTRALEIGRPVTAVRALSLLQGVRGAAAFRLAVLEARLNQKRKIKDFVQLFPDMFKAELRNSTLYVSNAAPTSSSSSSSAPAAPQRLVIDDQGRLLFV